jgi:hypothetical protein
MIIIFNFSSHATCYRTANQTTSICSLAGHKQATNRTTIVSHKPGHHEPGSDIRARLGSATNQTPPNLLEPPCDADIEYGLRRANSDPPWSHSVSRPAAAAAKTGGIALQIRSQKNPPLHPGAQRSSLYFLTAPTPAPPTHHHHTHTTDGQRFRCLCFLKAHCTFGSISNHPFLI